MSLLRSSITLASVSLLGVLVLAGLAASARAQTPIIAGAPELVNEVAAAEAIEGVPQPNIPIVSCGGSVGPDVTLGDLNSVTNYNTDGSIDAFSVGTTACNM